MKNKMIRFPLIFIVLIGSLIGLTNRIQAKTYKLYDVDLIDIRAIFKTNVLRIHFSYIDRDKSQNIHWKKKSADCTCVVFAFEKNAQNDNKHPGIASKREFLKKSDQKIYIDIPENISQKYSKGVVECEMSVGWEIFKAKDEFYF